MEIFLIIIVFIVVWFFTSTSKSEDVRSAIRFAKEAKDGTSKFLDELNDNLDDFNKDFEERTEKYIIESKRNILKKQKEYLVWLSELDNIDDINKSIKNMGLDGIDEDVTSIVDNFKEAGRYEEISHLVIKRSAESYVPNYDFGRQERDRAAKEKLAKEKLVEEKLVEEKLVEEKLAKALDDTTSLEDISTYVGEIDSYLIDFLKIRFYLSGKTSYPDLRCVDQYFNSKFSDLDKSSYGSIWQNIVSATVFDSSKCKNIDAIYHFTHKSNLSSILEYGILTRTNLNNMNLRYAFNDQMRLDGVLDSISLSFSHPNFKMFYKYRKQTSDDDWVVLKISPSLIYGKEQQISNRIEDFNYLNKAVFCNTNAASNKMRNLSIEERMTCNAFLDMFESPIGRALPTYTYDNQAEILYLGNIPVDFIEEIYTNHQNGSLNWVRELGYKVTENDIVFDQRRYRDG